MLPDFPPGGVLSRQHGQDTRVVAAGWLGLCSRNCQTLDRDGFLPPRAGWGAPWGFTALEPPADERDLGWMFFYFLFFIFGGPVRGLAASLGQGALGSQG